jgi:hypothetical protein
MVQIYTATMGFAALNPSYRMTDPAAADVANGIVVDYEDKPPSASNVSMPRRERCCRRKVIQP